MHQVTIRSRKDGIVELAPTMAPVSAHYRVLVIVTVLLTTGCLFVAGVLPAGVLGLIAASCIAGEIAIAVKAVALVLLRPLAEVHEVPRWRRR